jgi:hypothetical protein
VTTAAAVALAEEAGRALADALHHEQRAMRLARSHGDVEFEAEALAFMKNFKLAVVLICAGSQRPKET